MTNMDMLLQTVLTKYHLQAYQHTVEVIPPVDVTDPHLGIIATTDVPTMIMETGTSPVIPDHTHKILDTGVPVAMTPAGIIPGHFKDLHIIAPHATEAQVHTTTAMAHHITGPHLAEIFPEMTVDINNANPTNIITNQHKDPLQAHIQHLGNIRTEDTNRSQLTIHPQNTTAQLIRIVTRGQFKLHGPSSTSHTHREGYPMKTPSPLPISLTAPQSQFMAESATKHS